MANSIRESNKMRVGVIVGGTNEELNDAICTAYEIAKSLENSGKHIEIITYDDKFETKVKFAQIDLAFIVDATYLGKEVAKNNLRIVLENLGIPYTSSKVKAASITKNKSSSKRYFRKAGLLTPNYIEISSRNLAKINEVVTKNQVRAPYVIKPRDEGAGIDVLYIETQSELINVAKNLLRKHGNLIIENYIEGIELTVPILEVKYKAIPLSVIEIDKKAKVFSGDLKSLIQFSPEENGKKVVKYYIPARITKKIYKRCLEMAITAHNSIGCRGYSRVDMIVENKSADIYILEINSLPSISELGLFSKSVKLKGFSYNYLIENIIQSALHK